MVPMAAVSIVMAPIVGRYTDRVHPRVLTGFGFAFTAAAILWLSQVMTPDSATWEILLPMALLGFGMAGIWAPLAATATRNLPMRMAGAGAGVYNATRQVGAVLGSAAIAVLMDSRLAAEGLTAGGAGDGPRRAAARAAPRPVQRRHGAVDAAARGDAGARPGVGAVLRAAAAPRGALVERPADFCLCLARARCPARCPPTPAVTRCYCYLVSPWGSTQQPEQRVTADVAARPQPRRTATHPAGVRREVLREHGAEAGGGDGGTRLGDAPWHGPGSTPQVLPDDAGHAEALGADESLTLLLLPDDLVGGAVSDAAVLGRRYFTRPSNSKTWQPIRMSHQTVPRGKADGELGLHRTEAELVQRGSGPATPRRTRHPGRRTRRPRATG